MRIQLFFLFIALLNSITSFGADKLEPSIRKVDYSLLSACVDDDLDSAKIALKAGANINAIFGEGAQRFTPVQAAIASGSNRVTRFLVISGADLRSKYLKYSVRQLAVEMQIEGSIVKLIDQQIALQERRAKK